MPAIIFEHVNFQYESQAEPTLHDINLTINAGEKVLIAGPSGSGKSTLGNLINGSIPHSIKGQVTGHIRVGKLDTQEASLFDLSLLVGTVLQDPDSQFIGLTTAEDIAFGLENDRVARPEMHQRVEQWATRLGIAAQLHQSPQELSGGQKQRDAMAGVLIDDGDILLFDEPLAALDPASGHQSIALIDELHQQLHNTVIIIEHRIEDVLTRPVDRVILMAKGKIVADLKPDALLRSNELQQIGLREPLYIEALRYAGCDLNHIDHIDNVNALNAEVLAPALQSWQANATVPATIQSGEPLLDVRQLSFCYENGPQIFHDFDLTINRGDMLALVGRNGVGKSTLSQIITGFLTPSAGTLTYHDGHTDIDLAKLSVKERADKIGYIMQDPNQMISQVMIRDEVALGLRLRGVDEAAIKQRVDDTLKICGLYPFRNWPINALSFGQRKRVTIASILVLQPELLILDEPTAGQDWRHYTDMMTFLEQLNQQGITMMFITHDMHLMLEYANRTVVLGDQGVMLDAKPSTVLSNPTVVSAAALAPTSLYQLAERVHIDPDAFTQHVSATERKVRR